MPQISIIIPAYNASKTITACLDSIFNQTFKDYEIIIVNDGSTDDLLLALTTCSHRLTILNQENKGAPAARNYGFSQSSGKEVIFVDADIVLKPQALEKMHLALKTISEASFAYSQFLWGWKKFKLWPFDAEKLKQQPYIHTCSLIRREKLPGFDATLKKFQDWDLFLTLAERGGKGVFIPEVLFKVTTGGTMSQWLPSFVYKLPWLKLPAKENYEKWKKIVQEKHGI